MAVIYHFQEYSTAHLSSSPARQARVVVRQLNDLNGILNVIDVQFYSIQEAQRAFCSQLDVHLLKLEKTKEFARRCSAACELKSFEQMIKTRDQLIRDRRNKMARHQGGAKLGFTMKDSGATPTGSENKISVDTL